MNAVIRYAGFGLVGMLVSRLGYGLDTWQWWAAIIGVLLFWVFYDEAQKLRENSKSPFDKPK